MEASYFIAIIPPKEITTSIKAFQQVLADQFDARQCLGEIPHITLIPPFQMDAEKEQYLIELVHRCNKEQLPFECQLKDFSHFGKHTLFVNVATCDALTSYQENLLHTINNTYYLAEERIHYFQKYAPHITIGYKDLRPKFGAAKQYFSEQTYQAQFQFSGASILKCLSEDHEWGLL